MKERPIDILISKMRKRGWLQTELATRMNVSPSDITNWKTRGLPPAQYVNAAEAVGCSVDEIAGRWLGVTESDAPEYVGSVRLRRVPVVGTAKLGDDGYYNELSDIAGAGDGHIEIATRDPNAYGLRVRGMSMYPAIRDGWYVLIEPNSTPREGEYVLIILGDGRKMVKELLFQRPDAIEVMSVNGESRIRIERADIDRLQAVGAVVSPSKWSPD